MKSTWNNGVGPRGRQAIAVLVTEDGRVHRFAGSSIPGVCRADVVAYQRSGRWSNSTFAVEHRPSTGLVAWRQDWETGRTWPQTSWEAGFAWLASKAPGASRGGFEAAIRLNWPETAERWDKAAQAVDEFAEERPLVAAEETAAALAEMVRLQAETAADNAEAEALRRAAADVRFARDARDRAAARLEEVRAEAEALSGLDRDALEKETASIWAEIRQMEDRVSAARRRDEARAKRAEVGASLGAALDALGL
jgi:hypothetical protein